MLCIRIQPCPGTVSQQYVRFAGGRLSKVHELRLATRMAKVQEYMNSDEFTARDGGGLAKLSESLRERCRRLALLKGERLRT